MKSSCKIHLKHGGTQLQDYVIADMGRDQFRAVSISLSKVWELLALH